MTAKKKRKKAKSRLRENRASQERTTQPLAGHLRELGLRLLQAATVLVGASVGAFFFSDRLLHQLAVPAGKLVFTAPAEAFFANLKLSVALGAVVTLPYLLWHAYRFVAPALERRQRPLLALGLAAVLVLFYTGAAFALALLRPAMDFFLGFSGPRLQAMIRVNEYYSFLLTLVLGCGLVFEMPALVWVLARLGLVDAHDLASRWREALVGILVVAAFITPADVFTMLALAMPMGLLYLASIQLARWAVR